MDRHPCACRCSRSELAALLLLPRPCRGLMSYRISTLVMFRRLRERLLIYLLVGRRSILVWPVLITVMCCLWPGPSGHHSHSDRRGHRMCHLLQSRMAGAVPHPCQVMHPCPDCRWHPDLTTLGLIRCIQVVFLVVIGDRTGWAARQEQQHRRRSLWHSLTTPPECGLCD